MKQNKKKKKGAIGWAEKSEATELEIKPNSNSQTQYTLQILAKKKKKKKVSSFNFFVGKKFFRLKIKEGQVEKLRISHGAEREFFRTSH